MRHLIVAIGGFKKKMTLSDVVKGEKLKTPGKPPEKLTVPLLNYRCASGCVLLIIERYLPSARSEKRK